MKDENILEVAKVQFFKAMELINKELASNGMKPLRDSNVSKMAYTAHTLVGQMRHGETLMRHRLIIAFAEHFNIDKNYFYDSCYELKFDLDNHRKMIKFKELNNNTNELIDKKIRDFYLSLSEDGHIADNKVYDLLQRFKETIIEQCKHTPFYMVSDSIFASLDLLFEYIEEYLQTQSTTKESSHNTDYSIDNQTIIFYQDLLQSKEDLLQSKQEVIESKNEQIELLKQRIIDLENTTKIDG